MYQFKSQIQKLKGTIVLLVLLASCGGPKTENLSDLKAKQAELKSQLSAISEKISKLEGDSGKKFILVEAANIHPAIFKTYINSQGRVDAEESVSLSSEMPGTITKINVRAGDQVSKGQVLAETDARPLYQSMSDLQTNLDLANQMYEKTEALWKQKIGTEVQYLQAKAQKESLEKKMAGLQEQARMTKIISPIDGTVDAVDIKLGQLTAPGMPAIRVINFNNLKVKSDLAESYASRVHRGDEVMIKFPDANDTITASVTYVSRAINPMNRTFGVEVNLDNKKEYHPNQIAILSINDYKSAKPVISVPLNFVQKGFDGSSYILVANGNKTEKRIVKTGRDYNGRVEILEGINESDKVITTGFENLNEGDLIKVKQ